MEKIPALIIPTLGNYNGLQKSLDSIDFPISNVIIIDNGGKLESPSCEMADALHVIKLPSNIGVPAAWNLGIKLLPYCEWWLISSDDRRFKADSLRQIVSLVKPDTLIDAGAENIFSTFAVHESVISKAGLFDDFYYPGVGEEFSYIERLKNLNLKYVFIDDLTYGGDGITRKHLIKQSPKWEEIMLKNFQYAKAKKGATFGFNLRHRRNVTDIINRQ